MKGIVVSKKNEPILVMYAKDKEGIQEKNMSLWTEEENYGLVDVSKVL